MQFGDKAFFYNIMGSICQAMIPVHVLESFCGNDEEFEKYLGIREQLIADLHCIAVLYMDDNAPEESWDKEVKDQIEAFWERLPATFQAFNSNVEAMKDLVKRSSARERRVNNRKILYMSMPKS